MTQHQPEYIYDAALSTMWGVAQNLPFNETLRLGLEMGFPRVELNHAVTPDMLAEIDLKRYRIGSIHDPCPAEISKDELKAKDWVISSINEESRRKGIDITLRTIDLAVELGARSVIVHSGGITGDRSMEVQLRVLYEKGCKDTAEYRTIQDEIRRDRERRVVPYFASVARSIEDIIPHCRNSGISLGLENRYHVYDIPSPEELKLLLDLSKENWYGFQYDVGHAQALSKMGFFDHEDWLRLFSKRIIGVHLHDVKGITDHLVPGSGEVDYKMISPYLPISAFRTLEVKPDQTMKQIKLGMETLVEKGCVRKYQRGFTPS